GASATAATVTASVADCDAVELPSIAVAVTLSVKSASLLAGGVMVRPDSCAAVRLHTPPPWLVPADSVAPDGTLAMVIARVSDGSASAAPIDSAIGLSSLPAALATDSDGMSATPSTVTASKAAPVP